MLDFRVRQQRAQRLILKRGEAAIQLVPTRRVRAPRPRIAAVRAGDLDIIDTGNHPPDVGHGLRRGCVGRRVDQLDVRRQRKRDADQAVLTQIAEVGGMDAVDAKVVGVDRPEERIVGAGIAFAPQNKSLEPRLCVRRRELEVVLRHVAVGARTAVAVEPMRVTIQESEQAANDRRARLATALAVGVDGAGRRVGPEQRAWQRQGNANKERPDGSLYRVHRSPLESAWVVGRNRIDGRRSVRQPTFRA